MATFNEKTYRIELSHDDKDALYRHETPKFISHFWEYITSGKMKSVDHTPEVPKVDITK